MCYVLQSIANGFWIYGVIMDDMDSIEFRLKGVGKGHSRTGVRKKWTKQYYFEQDLLAKFKLELGDLEFSRKFCGYSADEKNFLWDKIKCNATKPKETNVHARNKLLLWLDKLHNNLKWKEIKLQYKIGTVTAMNYI